MIVLSKGLANCPVYPAEVVPESPIVGVPGGAAGQMVLTGPSHVVFHPGGPEIYGGGLEPTAFTWLVTCPSHCGTEASSTADAVEATTSGKMGQMADATAVRLLLRLPCRVSHNAHL
jgi:hypothetical protein